MFSPVSSFEDVNEQQIQVNTYSHKSCTEAAWNNGILSL